MARLPNSGKLSVSQINSLKNLGNTTTNISQRESQYMGGNPANVRTSGVCMPNQGQMNNNPRPGGTANVTWQYNGPSIAWRPTRFSEFRNSYNNLPTLTGTRRFLSGFAYGAIRIVCSGSDAGAPYSIFYNGTWYISGELGLDVFVNPGYHTFYVRDSENCGTNKEVGITIGYPGPPYYP